MDPSDFRHHHPSWALRGMDDGGRWACKGIDHAHFVDLIERLKALESQTWAQLETQNQRQHHYMNVNDLCRDARIRLGDLPQVDFDRIFSLRITGARRLWGVREGPIFRILWWDPDHTVCPMDIVNNRNR